MPYNNSPGAFLGARETLNRALESEKGIILKFPTRAAAMNFRARCNTARKRDREENKRTYDKDDPMHGCSPWDCLRLSIYQRDTDPEGWVALEILKTDHIPVEYEEIE